MNRALRGIILTVRKTSAILAKYMAAAGQVKLFFLHVFFARLDKTRVAMNPIHIYS